MIFLMIAIIVFYWHFFKWTEEAGNDTQNVEILEPLKDLSNFWRALEILLINCETSIILNWSAKRF